MSVEDTQEQKRKEWMGEVRYAALAGAISIVVAILFMANFERIHDIFINQNVDLIHKREFVQTAEGGKIRYVADDVRHGTVEQYVQEFEKDLQLLSRRFERGQFAMVTIAGSETSEPVQMVQQYSDQFAYSVNTNSDRVALTIQTDNRQAREALHQYMTYLSRYWMVNQEGEKTRLIENH